MVVVVVVFTGCFHIDIYHHTCSKPNEQLRASLRYQLGAMYNYKSRCSFFSPNVHPSLNGYCFLGCSPFFLNVPKLEEELKMNGNDDGGKCLGERERESEGGREANKASETSIMISMVIEQMRAKCVNPIVSKCLPIDRLGLTRLDSTRRRFGLVSFTCTQNLVHVSCFRCIELLMSINCYDILEMFLAYNVPKSMDR